MAYILHSQSFTLASFKVVVVHALQSDPHAVIIEKFRFWVQVFLKRHTPFYSTCLVVWSTNNANHNKVVSMFKISQAVEKPSEKNYDLLLFNINL